MVASDPTPSRACATTPGCTASRAAEREQGRLHHDLAAALDTRVARCALRPAPARRAAVEALPRARGGEGEDARIGAKAGGDPVGLDGTPAHDDVARARGEEDAAARGEGILVPAGHV